MCVLCGGDFVQEGLCPGGKIHRGDYVHVVKFKEGGGMSPLQNSWGGLCPRIQI